METDQHRLLKSFQQDLHSMYSMYSITLYLITSRLFTYSIFIFFPAGNLEKIAVIKDIFAGLEETTKPIVWAVIEVIKAVFLSFKL